MSNESAEQPGQSNGKSGNLKGSTNELPMLDLQAALEFINALDEKGLQTLSQAEVAKHMGYSTNTSTPFYRRTKDERKRRIYFCTQGTGMESSNSEKYDEIR